MLYLYREERATMDQAVASVLADRRFEHLGRHAEDAVWRFVCQTHLDHTRNYVPGFVDEHERPPRCLTCYFPIEHLTVEMRREVVGIVLLSVTDPELPPAEAWFDLSEPVGSVAAVPTCGTHLERMKDRGALLADHSLRVLRVALREHRFVTDEQLRFRRGTGYSFGENLAGWKRREDDGWNLVLDDELVELAGLEEVARLSIEPANDIEVKANLALKWLERGMLATDPLESLLFFFFALEALLGRKSEREKGQGLAFRRAMLAVATRGTFGHPDRLFFLYGQVRSAAVHGDAPPDVSKREARAFAWDVRRALGEYLEFARVAGVQRRGRLLTALENHSDRERLVKWALRSVRW